MNSWFLIALIAFILLSVIMTLIILVQRPQGGGLAGAFGGASGSGTDTVFGGRVGDALTTITVVLFVAFLGLAISLSLIDSNVPPPPVVTPAATSATPTTGAGSTQPVTIEATPIAPPITDPGGPLPIQEIDPSEVDEALRRDLEERVGGSVGDDSGESSPPGGGVPD